ncbi:hypothetical protein [Rothia aerolata]|uniref:hypothetical protein n=1 Tax=Rothia aerolata TaxID=1812262 RepID=UPI001E33F37D|nr:hypothetical protein [Rothia aerolata]
MKTHGTLRCRILTLSMAAVLVVGGCSSSGSGNAQESSPAPQATTAQGAPISLTSDEHAQRSHLSTAHGWSNDVQTIVKNQDAEGNTYYDVYFLHSADGATNPFGEAGQDWVHTTTSDFVHYSEQNSAIAAQGGHKTEGWKSAWTGSVITSDGSIAGTEPGQKVAFFTGLKKTDESQNTYAAASTDNGKTFTQVLNEGRPVIEADQSENGEDFRDPNVFYFEGKLLMYVAEGSVLGVYQSSDGVNWSKADETAESKVMPQSFYSGRDWNESNQPVECPVVETLRTADGREKQVLFFGAKDDAEGETTGTYYTVGHLDENGLFVQETEVQRLDQGSDYYGSNTTGTDDISESNDSIIGLGWVGNWNYFTQGVHSDQEAQSDYAQRLGSYSSARTLTLNNDLSVSSELVNNFGLENQRSYSATADAPATLSAEKQSAGSDTNGDIYLLYDLPHQVDHQYAKINFSKEGGDYDKRIYIDIWQGSDYVRLNLDPTNGWYNVKSYSAELKNGKEGDKASSYYYDGKLGEGRGYSAQTGMEKTDEFTIEVVTDRSSVEFFLPNGQVYTVSRFNTSGQQDLKVLTEDGSNISAEIEISDTAVTGTNLG